ncbi:retrovirus-related pol polyprotein from transposon TNT 1-94 [Tanacetum coccineum]
MSINGETVDQDDDDLAKKRDLLASLIEKLKCEIDESKNRNKILESSNKTLIDKLKGKIEDFKTKNKSLESSNKYFKEANNELSKTNQLMFKDLKKFQAELDRYHDVNYASKVEIDCAKAKNGINELFAHQETISIMSQEKEAQGKVCKTREEKELEKVIALENKIKFLDDIVYKTGQSVQTMNLLNRNCKISFVKPEFLKKAQRVNPRMYDIGCYNDNLALMLARESDEMIHLAHESRSKLNLKAQLQDKDNAISELRKLIANMKGKSVETKFEKPSVIRQPNALKSQRQSILGKPTTFSDSLTKKDFSKSKSVTINNVSNDFSKPVNAKILPQNVKLILKNTNVIALGMYKVHTKPNQTRTTQLPQDIRKTNKHVTFSIGVIPTTSVSGPQLKSNQLEDRVMYHNSQGKKQQVEDHHRNFKFSNNKMFVTACNDSLNAKTSNVNFVCVTCGKCVLNDNHDITREPKRIMNQFVATSLKKTVAAESIHQKPRNKIRKKYEHASKTCREVGDPPLVPYLHCSTSSLYNCKGVILFFVDSGCSKHITGNLKLLSNFVEKFLGTVKFGNDQTTLILGYGDLVQGNGNDLLTGSRGADLYSITLQDTYTPNLICLMAKASSSQAWLWHRHLSHLNFDTINLLSKYDIVTDLLIL